MTQNKLGDPAINYEVIRQRQREDAYSKGQIPSDKIGRVKSIMLIRPPICFFTGFLRNLPRSSHT